MARNNVFFRSFNIEFGSNVFIGYGNWFNGATDICIGDEVMFGPKSIIVSGNHTKLNRSFRYGPGSNRAIRVGRGSWIGGNCNILAGAMIGKGSVIGAGTVVNCPVPDDVVFAGNPGKVVKSI